MLRASGFTSALLLPLLLTGCACGFVQNSSEKSVVTTRAVPHGTKLTAQDLSGGYKTWHGSKYWHADDVLTSDFAIGKTAKVDLEANAPLSYQDLDLPDIVSKSIHEASNDLDSYSSVVVANEDLDPKQTIKSEQLQKLFIHSSMVPQSWVSKMSDCQGANVTAPVKKGKVLLKSDFSEQSDSKSKKADSEPLFAAKAVKEGSLITPDEIEAKAGEPNRKDPVFSDSDCTGWCAKFGVQQGMSMSKHELQSIEERLVHSQD